MKILAVAIIILCSLFLYTHRGGPITLASILSPGYSTCGKCGMPWNKVKEHTTRYTDTLGCFPLCEQCWSSLTPSTRLPYYKNLWDRWGETAHESRSWEDIEQAVLSGK